jgi:hypothetical protein
MVDQQASNTGRDGTRPAGDPKGVDAALAAGNNEARREDAASAAQVFDDAARQRGDVRGNGMQMMQTASSIGGGAVNATHDVLRSAIGATEGVASGLIGGASHVAADLVHGVRDIGYEVRDGATGLIGAAGAVGGSAVHTVADLLIDVVDGVRHVLGAAMGHRTNGQERTAEERQRDYGTVPPARPDTRSSAPPRM